MTRASLRLVAFLVLGCPPLHGQSARVTGSTYVRYIEVRPLISDSVASSDVPGEAILRQTADGRVVRCIQGDAFCHDVHPGDREATVPVIHDLEISTWGFGRGAYAFAQLRGRSEWGGSDLWPRGDDGLEVLAAYMELARGAFRVRAGRQWKVSGLGFYNFDGIAVEARRRGNAAIEAYGGRSLLRGLNEQRASGALESIEALAPRANGVVMGVHARYQHARTFMIGGVYQVDFRDDGEGLFSELAAADMLWRLGRLTIESALELDVASASLNEARLRVHSPPIGRITLNGELRRYRPYFELWTIWGAFSPVGFDEARGGITWAAARGRLIVQGDASYRSYDDAQLEPGVTEFRTSGWGIGANINWTPAPLWRVQAGTRIETGFGAARRDAQAGATREFGERLSVGVQALAFQRLFEFRLQEGTVIGAGAEAAWQLSERTRVFTSATSYRHLQNGSVPESDWNQRRASIRVQWTVGSEPTMSAAQP